MRAPLLTIALAFALGIGFQWRARLPEEALALLACLAGALLHRRWRFPKRANLCLWILVVTLGAFHAFLDSWPPADSVARYLTATPQPITCEGEVVSDADWFKPSQGPARLQGWFQISGIRQGEGWIPAHGRVWTRFPTVGPSWGYGDRLRLHGSVRGPRSVSNADRPFNESHWLWLHNACGVLTISDPEALTPLESPRGFWVRYRRWVASFRGQLRQLGRSLLGPFEIAYLEAFLLGDGRGIPRETWEAFKKSGTVHVLVVSGQHVALIGYMVFLCLSLTRISPGLRQLWVAVALIVYCTLTGGAPPILRATIMGGLLCVGMSLGREVPPRNSLGLAALVILAIHPRALADVSFQLSFAAVFGLLGLSPWFAGRLNVARLVEEIPAEAEPLFQRWNRTLWRWTGKGLAVSCGAWIAVTPIVAWHFQTMAPIAIVANLIVVPLASLLIATGFLVYAVGWIGPLWAMPFAAGFSCVVSGLNRLVTELAALPAASWQW